MQHRGSKALAEAGVNARRVRQHAPPLPSQAQAHIIGVMVPGASTSTIRMPGLFGKRGGRPTAHARRGARKYHPAVAANTRAELEMRIKSPAFMGDVK